MKKVKHTILVAMLLCPLLFAGCNDGIQVQQSYDFGISTWHLPQDARPGEAVEIRFTLRRQGDFKGAAYRIGYIQIAGHGEVFDNDGQHLVNRETMPLEDVADLDTRDPCEQIFTLYYRATASEKSEVRFCVVDNFGIQKEITLAFEVKDTN